MNITLKNYRCFPDSQPAKFSIRPGFTAFVGSNNAGKSTILKFFFEFRPLLSNFTAPQPFAIGLQAGRLGPGLVQGIGNHNDALNHGNDRDLIFELSLDAGDLAEANATSPSVTRVELVVNRGEGHVRLRCCVGSDEIPIGQNYVLEENTWLLGSGKRYGNLEAVLSAFRDLSRMIYIGAFRNAINAGGSDNYFDIHTGETFVRDWRQLKTGDSKTSVRHTYALIEDIRRIFGYERLDVDASTDDRTLQLVIDGHPYKLTEVGSGIAHFILAFTSAAVRNPSYVLIDEPEINLHPSLQRDFLISLASYGTKGVVFSTHSIGLARSIADSLYSVRRIHEGESVIRLYEETPNLGEFLGSLNFSGYQELGFNKVLLVEGPSEIRTIEHFLRLLGLNHQIVMLPLGGASMINPKAGPQLEELKRITTNIVALVDSERTALGAPLDSDHVGFEAACKTSEIRLHILDRRATENYFTDAAVKGALGGSYSALGPYERLSDSSRPWAKENNWRIAREMSLDDLKGTDLGTFLESL
jgi:ABC-type cobalamin/Fe3+-siderophores transport system ATPase subunit